MYSFIFLVSAFDIFFDIFSTHVLLSTWAPDFVLFLHSMLDIHMNGMQVQNFYNQDLQFNGFIDWLAYLMYHLEFLFFFSFYKISIINNVIAFLDNFYDLLLNIFNNILCYDILMDTTLNKQLLQFGDL